MMRGGLAAGLVLCCLAACQAMPPGTVTKNTTDAELVKGPPIQDIVTEFDKALICLKGKFPERVAFGVGAIADTTGKEQYADNGTGKLVSQGAGDMVQSALFRAGLTVVNRRDPNIPLAENNWGIRNIRTQIPADLFISGSITSLDFIPGGGAELSIAGVGPRYRQNRILIALDLALTDANTGKVVANVPLQKQLYAEELGFEATRYFGDTLLEAELGGMEREALNHTLRQMLSYAVFELLAQTMDGGASAGCRSQISSIDANASGFLTGDGSALREVTASADAAAAARKGPPEGAAPAGAAPGGAAPAASPAQAPAPETAPSASAQTPAKPADPAAVSPPKARQLASVATAHAARAIAAGDDAARATTAAEADKAATQSELNMAMAARALQEAALAGLTGIEGDAAATLVEQALRVATEARRIAKAKAEAEAAAQVPAVVPPAAALPQDDIKLGGSGKPMP